MHTILFVDDNRNIREFCKRELEREGYRVLLAGDGEEALDVLRRKTSHLVILDVHIPNMDRISTLGRLLAQGRDLPVIFYTTHKECVSYYCGWLAEAYVEKSEDLTELKSTIAQTLARRQRRKCPNLLSENRL